MALGRKMDDAVHTVSTHQLLHLLKVANVGFHKRVVSPVLNVLKVGKVAGVCEFVEVDNVVVWIFVDQQSYHMAAYETGTAGNYNVAFKFHFDYLFLLFLFYLKFYL